MLKQIISDQDEVLALIKDDPVRPHIPSIDRISHNKKVFYLSDESNNVLAIICVAFTDHVATTELELSRYISMNSVRVCMFYTIWSYDRGSGRQLALEMVEHIKTEYPDIKRVVTLSPKTEVARRFHLKNGAFELQVNTDTVNFEYLINDCRVHQTS